MFNTLNSAKKISKTLITKHKPLLLGAIVVVIVAASSTGAYALSHHSKRVTHLPSKTVTVAKPVVAKAPTPTPQPVATPAPQPSKLVVTPKPTPSPVVITQPAPAPVAPPVYVVLPASISFSGGGCYVTATGTPGMILSGSIHNVPDTHGGPMGPNPDGVAIPNTGTLTEEVALGPFSYTNDQVDAVLTDQAGNTVFTGSVIVTAPTCQ